VVIADKIAYIYKPGSISVIKIAEHAKIGKQIAELQSKQRVLSRKIRTLSVKPKKTDGKAEAAEQVAKRTTELDSAKLEQKKISEQLGGLQKASAACFGWKASCPQASEMIIAGKTIYLGAENAVHALSASDGKLLWTGKVDGKAAGLAVAAGRFYASTDKGKIHCFTPGK
jgi:hypothetical protein